MRRLLLLTCLAGFVVLVGLLLSGDSSRLDQRPLSDLLNLAEVMGDPGVLDIPGAAGRAALRRGWLPAPAGVRHIWTRPGRALFLLPLGARDFRVLGLEVLAPALTVVRVQVGGCPESEIMVGTTLELRLVSLPEECMGPGPVAVSLYSPRDGGGIRGIAVRRVIWGDLPGAVSERIRKNRGPRKVGVQVDGGELLLTGPVTVRFFFDAPFEIELEADKSGLMEVFRVPEAGPKTLVMPREGRYRIAGSAGYWNLVSVQLQLPRPTTIRLRGWWKMLHSLPGSTGSAGTHKRSLEVAGSGKGAAAGKGNGSDKTEVVMGDRQSRLQLPSPFPTPDAGFHLKATFRSGNPLSQSTWIPTNGGGGSGAGGEEAVGSRRRLARRLPETPDIVILVLDAAAVAAFGAWGAPDQATPNLDRLALEWAQFETVQSTASFTSASTASLFSGTLPPAHAVEGFTRLMPETMPVMAQILQDAGYRTVGVVCNERVTAKFGFRRGFSEFHEIVEPVPERRARPATDQVLALLGEPAKKPLFLYVHYLPPHFPYRPPFPYSTLRTTGVRQETTIDEAFLRKAELGQLSDSLEDFIFQAYLENLSYIDSLVGELLWALEKRDRPTLLVLLADHGEGFGRHGRYSHASTVYEEMCRIPLLIRGPGAPAGLRRDLVSTVDLLPTFLDLLGIELQTPIQGESLLPSLLGRDRGGVPSQRTAYARAATRPHYLESLRDGRYKLIIPRSTWRPELYDLLADPGESRNLALDNPVRSGWMQLRLRGLLRRSHQIARRYRAGVDTELSGEDLQRLEALGYLQ